MPLLPSGPHLPGPASMDLICFPDSRSHRRMCASRELEAAMAPLWLMSTDTTPSWWPSRVHCSSSFSSDLQAQWGAENNPACQGKLTQHSGKKNKQKKQPQTFLTVSEKSSCRISNSATVLFKKTVVIKTLTISRLSPYHLMNQWQSFLSHLPHFYPTLPSRWHHHGLRGNMHTLINDVSLQVSLIVSLFSSD